MEYMHSERIDENYQAISQISEAKWMQDSTIAKDKSLRNWHIRSVSSKSNESHLKMYT